MTTTTEDPSTEVPASEPEQEPFDAERARAKIAKANSEAANLRKRMKDLEAKAARLDELEESSKTETQRIADQQRSLEDRAVKADAEAARLRVALRKGLTETQARRLVGATDEELEADADELLASFKPADPGSPPGPPGRPSERLTGGGDPTTEPDPDIDTIVSKIRRV
jgi:hypothetical protein